MHAGSRCWKTSNSASHPNVNASTLPPHRPARRVDPCPPSAQHPGAGYSPRFCRPQSSPPGSQPGGFFMSGARLDPDPGGVQRRSVEGSQKVPGMELAPFDSHHSGGLFPPVKFGRRRPVSKVSQTAVRRILFPPLTRRRPDIRAHRRTFPTTHPTNRASGCKLSEGFVLLPPTPRRLAA
jgi:hypothetical protein